MTLTLGGTTFAQRWSWLNRAHPTEQPPMNWLVVHIASGHSFFSGLVLLMLAAATTCSPRDRVRRLAPLLAIIGVLAVAVSSTAIPYWAYALLAFALAHWMVSGRDERRRKRSAVGLAAVCALCVSMELPYHVTPTFTAVNTRTLAIIGDSVTAGGGVENREVTWPDVFARQHDVRVDDLSHVGETAASALKRARQHQIDAPLVLVEIGGNDVLGSTTARQFEQDLDALLAYITAPDRKVVMFELPLPPFYHEFGRAQRAAARRHNVALIPKRVFLGLLAGNGATLDSIHLSQAGHEQMADVMWRLLGPAYADAAVPELQSTTIERPGR